MSDDKVTRSADQSSSESGGQSGAVPPGGLLTRLLGLVFHRNYLVGVIDDPERADAATAALAARGFTQDAIARLSGPELNERVRQAGDRDQLLTSEEGSICLDLDEAANTAGGTIISVYATSPEQVERAVAVLREQRAHDLKYFGDWTITHVPSAG